ncbi:MAG: sulfatase-like hydrolase/transferase [Halioglobus sp.]
MVVFCFLWSALSVSAQPLPDVTQAPGAAPNIIVILADDLGYGDISSFGAQGINTPHIDQLAADGLKLTQFYAAAPVCTPSRAGLLTGRLAARMGMRHVFMYDAPDGMPQSEITIPEQLKQAGYHTGMVGKWHLGHLERYMPWNQGFDEFYGVPYSNDMANFFFYENQEMSPEPIDQRYLTRRYTDKAVDYIERHAEQPFFLYLAHSMPHVPLYVSPEFEGSSELGLYGDVVQELDWSTGQVVDKLRELGLLENTLVIFSSDNGPWLAMGDDGGSAGSLRDGKGSTFEGGQRVPTVAHWPAQIAPGRVDSTPTSLLDLMPTFSALAGVPLPTDRAIDGGDISAVLIDGDEDPAREFYYISSMSTQVVAYRDGDWKIKLPRSGYPALLEPVLKLDRYSHGLMLFNLEDDPSEQNNLAGQHPERVVQLKRVIADLQKDIDSEGARELYMSSTSADHKGYGPLMVKAGLVGMTLLFGVLGLIYALYRFAKTKLQARRLKGAQ